MRQVIIRVELKGDPSGDVYKQLHSYMSIQNKWETKIESEKGSMNLPHAMYSGSTDLEPLDLAVKLKERIESAIWKSAIVLIIDWHRWGQAGS
jgi:hypothetical protein